MACLLVLAIAAGAVLTAPPSGKLTHAARTPMTSPEAFWRAALLDAPMPESIRELLRPGAADAEVVKAPRADADDIRDDNDPPPPMNFNYDDYKASPSPRNHQLAVVATHAKAPEHVDDGAARAPAAAALVFFLEDEVRVGGTLPFPGGLLPRAAPAGAAGRSDQPPVELYAVRDVRAVEGSSFVVCRGEYHRSDGGGAVYGCCGVGPARAYAVDVAGDGERGDAVAATVVCRAVDDNASNDGNLERAAASRLLGVKPGGAAVCYAVPDAQMLLVKTA